MSCESIKKESVKSELNKKLATEFKYDRVWGVHNSEDNSTKSETEMYISGTDTIYQQYKLYKDGKIDSTKSNFYVLELNKTGDSTYSGKVHFNNVEKYWYKSRVNEVSLGLSFLHMERDSGKVWNFESKNKNYVEFKYFHHSDTLVGMLYETRHLDTIINGEKMIRILEYALPIDNMSKTNNPYIETFELTDNKYVR